jgi:hypothetical protein
MRRRAGACRVLGLIAVCVIAGVLLAVVLSVLFVMKPKRLKLSASALKIVNVSFEADAGDDKKELTPGAGS